LKITFSKSGSKKFEEESVTLKQIKLSRTAVWPRERRKGADMVSMNFTMSKDIQRAEKY
jgi:hypothetical protein